MLVEAWCSDFGKIHFLEVGMRIPEDLEIYDILPQCFNLFLTDLARE
jgi:hypothetical protein